MIKLFVEHKWDVNLQNKKYSTPFFCYLNNNLTFEILQFFVQNGADLSTKKEKDSKKKIFSFFLFFDFILFYFF